tara:strand:+ start:832 stop:1173 length:342 start_codon:yes stop_codon:yes gene_type:complete
MPNNSEYREKYYYKIGELEKITGVSSTKIRYWSQKFKSLKDQMKTSEGYSHKLYHHKSIDVILNLMKFHNEINIKSQFNEFDEKLADKINRKQNIAGKIENIRNTIKRLIETP